MGNEVSQQGRPPHDGGTSNILDAIDIFGPPLTPRGNGPRTPRDYPNYPESPRVHTQNGQRTPRDHQNYPESPRNRTSNGQRTPRDFHNYPESPRNHTGNGQRTPRDFHNYPESPRNAMYLPQGAQIQKYPPSNHTQSQPPSYPRKETYASDVPLHPNYYQRPRSPDSSPAERAVRSVKEGDLASLKQMVYSGEIANVNTIVADGDTLLSLAVVMGRLDMVQLLCSAKADVHLRRRDGKLPLHLAEESKNIKIERFLMLWSHVAATSSLHLAALQGSASDLARLQRHTEVLSIDEEETYGRHTPLQLAAKGGHVECVQLLLYARAEVSRRHPVSFETPLVSAVMQSNVSLVDMLLHHGADAREEYLGVDLVTWAKQAKRSPTVVEQLERAATQSQRSRARPGERAGERPSNLNANGAGPRSGDSQPRSVTIAHFNPPSAHISPRGSHEDSSDSLKLKPGETGPLQATPAPRPLAVPPQANASAQRATPRSPSDLGPGPHFPDTGVFGIPSSGAPSARSSPAPASSLGAPGPANAPPAGSALPGRPALRAAGEREVSHPLHEAPRPSGAPTPPSKKPQIPTLALHKVTGTGDAPSAPPSASTPRAHPMHAPPPAGPPLSNRAPVPDASPRPPLPPLSHRSQASPRIPSLALNTMLEPAAPSIRTPRSEVSSHGPTTPRTVVAPSSGGSGPAAQQQPMSSPRPADASQLDRAGASRGTCRVCGEAVLVTQPRFKDDGGIYFHERCYKQAQVDTPRTIGGHSPRTSLPVVRAVPGGAVSGSHVPLGANQPRSPPTAFDIAITTPRRPETPRLPEHASPRPGRPAEMGVQRVGSGGSALSPRSEASEDGSSASALVTASFTSMDVRMVRVTRALIVGADGSRTGGLGLSFVIDEMGYPSIAAMADGGTARQSGMLSIGDAVVAVDGVSCSGKSAQEVINLIKGEVGTQAALLLRATKSPHPPPSSSSSQQRRPLSAAQSPRVIDAPLSSSPRSGRPMAPSQPALSPRVHHVVPQQSPRPSQPPATVPPAASDPGPLHSPRQHNDIRLDTYDRYSSYAHVAPSAPPGIRAVGPPSQAASASMGPPKPAPQHSSVNSAGPVQQQPPAASGSLAPPSARDRMSAQEAQQAQEEEAAERQAALKKVQEERRRKEQEARSRPAANLDPPAARPPGAPAQGQVALKQLDEGKGAGPGGDGEKTVSDPVFFVAAYAYAARQKDELSFAEGERLAKINSSAEKGWVIAFSLVTGSHGLVPLTHVNPMVL